MPGGVHVRPRMSDQPHFFSGPAQFVGKVVRIEAKDPPHLLGPFSLCKVAKLDRYDLTCRVFDGKAQVNEFFAGDIHQITATDLFLCNNHAVIQSPMCGWHSLKRSEHTCSDPSSTMVSTGPRAHDFIASIWSKSTRWSAVPCTISKGTAISPLCA